MAFKSNVLLLFGGLFFLSFGFRNISLLLSKRRASKKYGCKPAFQVPQSETIIGYGLLKEQLKAMDDKNVLGYMANRFRKYGNTFAAEMMGESFIGTIEPENIQAILVTKFDDFGIQGRKHAFGPLLGNGIFTSDGAQWRHSRALIRPSFVKSQISDLDIFETHIQTLISLIPHNSDTVDLQPLFFRLTLDSATEYLFGKSVASLHNVDGPERDFATSIDYALSEIPRRYRFGRFNCFRRNKKFIEACKTVHDYVDPFVHAALQGQPKDDKEKGRYTLLYELAKATQDPIQLRHELLNILVAGRDTTASLLSSVIFILARRPDVWAKLNAEVQRLGGKRPDYETLRQMKYLKYIVNEALRLYPVVPANSRYAVRNTTIPTGGGVNGKSPIFVIKGQIVMYSVMHLHRRKDIYGPDADEFKPDRWETLRAGWAYLPFNGGPRICIGQQFALTE
ncbi:putative cytochrome P450 alkane hydroxylase [Venustampulla echinocandica]|uniref:Putative cytochrome P450 alkane hydroxylase n=1 Tax=Venustampulla echinocandica TaxID=2656787 RepID=A0A370TK24_9HELO|nr:putative cytochrome P450 alkane hydroxylase [Venustampulla echinocandica]RDL35873.1 putative cytochrome P450 alkane hydroxylase [Venustampulla echinocandica]